MRKARKIFILTCIISLITSCYSDRKPSNTPSDFKNGVVIYDSINCMNGINCNSGFQYIDMHGNNIRTLIGTLCITIDDHRYVGISGGDKFSLFDHDSVVWAINDAPRHVAFMDEDSNLMALMGYQEVRDKGSVIKYEELTTINLKG